MIRSHNNKMYTTDICDIHVNNSDPVSSNKNVSPPDSV